MSRVSVAYRESDRKRVDEQCMACWHPTTPSVVTVAVGGLDIRLCGDCLYEARDRFGPLDLTFIGPAADFNAQRWAEYEQALRGQRP